uniref:Ly6/PLAUR domain-containing protein 1 isoform X2 n=1 Tax=Petromyzon marinus TaxID=7757 RepID=A0AAJ7WK91_PETMA|nr:ly6/PLAUR domain-containing protein 1 isoform X2 [Petromyzon marinus]
MRVPLGALALLCLLSTGRSLQIQCYQCEEFHLSECSAPKNIANCTVNVQDVCQKEVMIRSNAAAAAAAAPVLFLERNLTTETRAVDVTDATTSFENGVGHVPTSRGKFESLLTNWVTHHAPTSPTAGRLPVRAPCFVIALHDKEWREYQTC